MKIRNRTVVSARPSILLLLNIWLRLSRWFGLKERIPGNEKLSVVLLSYKRPQNMRYIVDSLLACEFVQEIVLSNNNPQVRMENFLHSRDPRLKIINQCQRFFPTKRYDLARKLQSRYFMSIDDDVFLLPGQIKKLFMALLENPSVPHGTRGENFVVKDGKVVSCKSVGRKKMEVDVLIWLYAFTREHLREYFSLLDHMKISQDDVKFSDDVILSFSGKGRPRCVNLGPILCCPSSRDKNIAVYRQEGFHEQRYKAFLQCRQATGKKK